jgi:hypothetical protein
MSKATRQKMDKATALKLAHERTTTTGQTQCLYVKVDKKGEEDWLPVSAYEPKPAGYKLSVWVSVTGLERAAS